MTYNMNKPTIFQREDNPTTQAISTTYVEPVKSRVHVGFSGSTAKIYYKYSCYAYQTGTIPLMLHVKLQKSNDNFSSDIEDVDGCNFNFSGDTAESPANTFYSAFNAMFVIENLDKRYLRLMVRSYNSSTTSNLHRSTQWDGQTNADVYYNPSCIAMEV